MPEQDQAAEQEPAGQEQPHGDARAQGGLPHAPSWQPGPPDAKGFLNSLFDTSFTTFVTPQVIRVLYLLIIIAVLLAALVYVVLAFSASIGFGLLVLFIGAPLLTIIWLAMWRIILEAFMVVFRIADDVRAIRDR